MLKKNHICSGIYLRRITFGPGRPGRPMPEIPGSPFSPFCPGNPGDPDCPGTPGAPGDPFAPWGPVRNIVICNCNCIMQSFYNMQSFTKYCNMQSFTKYCLWDIYDAHDQAKRLLKRILQILIYIIMSFTTRII